MVVGCCRFLNNSLSSDNVRILLLRLLSICSENGRCFCFSDCNNHDDDSRRRKLSTGKFSSLRNFDVDDF